MLFTKKIFYLFITFLFFIISVSGCNFHNNSEEKQNVSLVTWNTQTFFDSITEGTEYSEFKKQENWNKEKYISRLERLCEVMNTLNADIYVFQEIENESVMYDISNMLAGNTWNKKQTWPFGSFSKNKNSTFGYGVFSKYPINYIKNHNLFIKTECTTQPSLRPVSQVSINVNNKELIIFLNHWKSKYGGEEETKIWRDWQETLLNYSISSLCSNTQASTPAPDKTSPENNKYIISVGDYNRDAMVFFNEKTTTPTSNNSLLKTFMSDYKNIPAYSPWFSNKGEVSTNTGSYFYKDNWERIDNIFSISNNIEITNFTPATEGPWVDENKKPLRYELYNNTGYSDHLPLMCNIIFKN